MKRFLMVSVLVFLVALSVTAVVMATPPEYFYLEKICDGSAGPDACRLQNLDPSDPFSLLEGGRIIYDDKAYFENPAGVVIESAEVYLETADGTIVAGGHVRWVKDHGYFTFRHGSGPLTGLHARGVVNWVEGATFTLTGTYHFEP